jgi:rhodanese-related sulfurtransferase
MTSSITRDEIVAILEGGEPIVLVETLRPQHFDQGHLPGAIHLHFDDVEERAAHLLPDRDALIVTYCSNTACQNSRMVAAKLAKLGYTNVRRYEAGKQDWSDAGLELETGAVPA